MVPSPRGRRASAAVALALVPSLFWAGGAAAAQEPDGFRKATAFQFVEVVDPDELTQPLNLPPDGLPHRRLFWREEMADGIVDIKADQPGMANPLDWYRYKADLMRFLGMNTYSKDLLEFGACQHWDSTPHGGNDWVFHDSQTKYLWAEIVELMGSYGFDVLPYYEYSGSKGYKGLGNQRRARPLTRDDAYTHISWIESARADVTDPGKMPVNSISTAAAPPRSPRRADCTRYELQGHR